MVAHPARQRRVVEVVVLDEGNGGDGSLFGRALVDDNGLFAGGLARYLDVGDGGDAGGEVHGSGDDDADADLAHNLVFALEAVLVVVLEFLVVVEEADGAQPQRRQQHQQHVRVGEVGHQQAGDDDGEDDDDAAHGGCAFLLFLVLETEVAHNLAHLMLLQHVDDTAAEDDGDEHGQHECGARAHGHVFHEAASGHALAEEVMKEVVKHFELFFIL